MDGETEQTANIISEGEPESPPCNFSVMVKSVNLDNVTKAIGHITDEFKVMVGQDQFLISVVDPAHVMMGHIILRPQFFEDFHIIDGGNVGLDTDSLKSILNLAKKTKTNPDIITLCIDIDKNKVRYQVKYHKGTIKLIDTIGMSDPRLPETPILADFEIKVSDVLDFLKRASEVSDHVIIKVKTDSVIFLAEGEENEEMEIPTGTESVHDIRGEPCESKYSLDYITNMFKAMKGATDKVKIYMNTNYPIKMVYEIANGTGTVTFLLAPRLSND